MNAVFMKVMLAGMAAATFGGAAQVAQAAEVEGPKLSWDVSLWGKPRAFTAGVEKLAAMVNAKTGGNWQMTLHYGGALSKSRENLDGIAVDAFQGAMFCNFYHPQKNPALMVLTMPFLPMSDWDNNRKIREAVYAHPAVIKELAQWNAMTYASSYLPQYEFLGKGTPPTKLEDWKGLTVRAGGGVGQAMKVLGATPTSSSATEVYTGVQQGTMDAASFPFTYSHVAYKIHEVTDWFTSNLSPGTSDCPMVFSINAYNELPEQYKQLLGDVKEEVIKTQIQAYIDIDKKNLPMLKSKLKEVRYSDETLAAFRAAAGKPVIEAWIEENQGKFDARGLVETIFKAVGQTY
jgi:TRAP-type C4-dicarboxylate transport system substrate-binding protein